jgi:RNA polymerase sigma-70 factor (ECF subfamily)
MIDQSVVVETGLSTRRMEREHEDELVLRASRGDADAFSDLYERFADRIYRYIYFRVTDGESAEDLTSKVFLKAWEHLPTFRRSNSPFIAWLYTIAHNTLVDFYRTSRQTARLDEVAALPALEPSPAEQTDQRLEAQRLRRAVEELSPTQRNVITMRLIEGMATDEIAERLHKSEGAVRAVQMRALQALEGILRKQEGIGF